MQEVITMDIKAKIEEIVEKLKNDPNLLNKFNTNPVGLLEDLIGIDLPDDQLNSLIDGIKAKLSADKIGDALGGLGKLFGK